MSSGGFFDFSVADYGWYLLAAGVLSAYIWTLVQPHVSKYLKEREEKAYAAKYHKDPDVYAARLAAQQAAALQLQEKYNRDAEEYKKKMEEKEEKKRHDWIEKQENQGHRLGHGSGLKPEYNPLMSDNQLPSYRPQRRSGCPGGGCGR